MFAILVLIARFLLPSAYAQTLSDLGSDDPSIAQMWSTIKAGGFFAFTNAGNKLLQLLLLKISSIVLSLIGGTAVCVLIYAGIRLMLTGEEGKAEAKKTITYALIAVVLAISADAIVAYVIGLVKFAATA